MDRWKKAGRAGRNEDDELWAKFREAADTFFNARQADRDQINSSEKENLAAKEALLVKAEALVPVKTDAEARRPARSWPRFRKSGIRSVTCRVTICAASRTVSTPLTSRSSHRGCRLEADRPGGRRPQVQLRGAAQRPARRARRQDRGRVRPEEEAKLEAEKATKEQWLNAIK